MIKELSDFAFLTTDKAIVEKINELTRAVNRLGTTDLVSPATAAMFEDMHRSMDAERAEICPKHNEPLVFVGHQGAGTEEYDCLKCRAELDDGPQLRHGPYLCRDEDRDKCAPLTNPSHWEPIPFNALGKCLPRCPWYWVRDLHKPTEWRIRCYLDEGHQGFHHAPALENERDGKWINIRTI